MRRNEPTGGVRQKSTSAPRNISWDEFQLLGPPADVRADVALSIFGPGRYADEILPQTWEFVRRHNLGFITLHGPAR
jgi:hypothetical protein